MTDEANQANSSQVSAMQWLRVSGWLEGISYLVLLLVAMPLKYLAGFPEAVSIVGAVHGFAFVTFVIIVARMALLPFWSVRETAFAMVASLLPAGTIILDFRWKAIQNRLRTEGCTQE